MNTQTFDNKEQLTFCLRWIDENIEAHEDFIGFYQISNIEAVTITSAIKDALTRLQLSLNECRGQCYDGASNMLGKSQQESLNKFLIFNQKLSRRIAMHIPSA